LIGTFQNETASISTASVNLSNPIKGTIRNVTVQIQTPYVGAGAVTIQIGTASNPTLISDGSTLDETTAGLYPITCVATFATATQLIVTINGAPSAGAALVMIDYVQG
jgi:subtilisin-like proprotein convertase family protein